MGQASLQGIQDAGTLPPAVVQTRLQKHALELKQVAVLSYDSFLKLVAELNAITQSFCDANGKQLQFQVKKDTDSTIFWKGTVRIRCHKVNCRTGVIESTRLLNLKQFIRLHGEITQQASMATITPEGRERGLCASMIIQEFDTHLNQFGDLQTDSNECCICMDRRAEVILSCSHSYCEQCIDEWNFNHKTCPICRAKVSGKDDTWVLTEKPDETEMVYETRGYLMGLADRTGAKES